MVFSHFFSVSSHFFPCNRTSRFYRPPLFFFFFFFFVTPFYLFFPYHFSRFNLTIIWVKYNFDKLYASEINRMQKYLFLMIYVCFFLRSLCSLLPTHIKFSWSRQFIQKCLKIARGCCFLPLIPDLYPVVLNCFCLLFFIMVVTSAIGP